VAGRGAGTDAGLDRLFKILGERDARRQTEEGSLRSSSSSAQGWKKRLRRCIPTETSFDLLPCEVFITADDGAGQRGGIAGIAFDRFGAAEIRGFCLGANEGGDLVPLCEALPTISWPVAPVAPNTRVFMSNLRSCLEMHQ
jgi:hypothetical protein